MYTEQEKEEALKRLEEWGTVSLSYDDGVDCEGDLAILGLDTDLIYRCLHQIDYLSCSIKYDGEYHLGGQLQEEEEELYEELSKLDEYGIDYEVN